MSKYRLVIVALLFIGFGVQAQKKAQQKGVKSIEKKGAVKKEQSDATPPAEQQNNKAYDSTLFKLQEQLHSKNLRNFKRDLSLMAEPNRPIL